MERNTRMIARRGNANRTRKYGDTTNAPAYSDETGAKVMLDDLEEDFDGSMVERADIDGRHPNLDPPSIVPETKPLKVSRGPNFDTHWAVHLRTNMGIRLEIGAPALSYRRTIGSDTFYFWTQEDSDPNPALAYQADNERHINELPGSNATDLDWQIPAWTGKRRLFVAHHSDGHGINAAYILDAGSVDNTLNQLGGFSNAGTMTLDDNHHSVPGVTHEFTVLRTNRALNDEFLAGKRLRVSA